MDINRVRLGRFRGFPGNFEGVTINVFFLLFFFVVVLLIVY